MKPHTTLFLPIFALMLSCAQAQGPGRSFIIGKQSGKVDAIPVSVKIDADIFQNPENYSLFEVAGNARAEVPFQTDPADPARAWFFLHENGNPEENRSFVFEKKFREETTNPVEVDAGISILRVLVNGKAVLDYQMGFTEAPEGANPLFRRSGFIHPVWSPAGERLTAIQPRDHIHHYGIWNPWTKTFINDRETDFWNLAKGEGTVQFSKVLSLYEGPVFGGFKVHHEHLDFKASGPDRTAINEIWDVRVWNRKTEGRHQIIDLSSQLNTPLETGILFQAYRYGGGLGFRGTERWGEKNSSVITSEGKTRRNADGTKARWTIIEGESDHGRSGILFLSHPYNRDHPEPIRAWTADSHNGVSNMFFNITPIRDNDWELKPGRDYLQRYRMVVFDGKMTVEEAEEYWQLFANPPVVQ